QHALMVLLIAALVLGVLARPAPSNGRFRAALDEIETFRGSFERSGLERSLVEYAQAQGRQPLAAVQRAAASKLQPDVRLAENAPPLQPLAAVELATLAEAQHFAKPDSTLPLGVPDAAALGRSLGWRLSHELPAPKVMLQSVEVAAADVTQADLDLEPQV